MLRSKMTSQVPVVFGSYSSLSNLVDETVDEITAGERKPEPAPDPNETITRGELSDALVRMGYVSLHADRLFADMKQNKAPEWEPGDLVRDAGGEVFQRGSDRNWVWMGHGGTWSDSKPLRPLKRLAVEA